MSERATIQGARDALEDALLRALDARETGRNARKTAITERRGDYRKEVVSLDKFCPARPAYPRHALMVGIEDGRLYSPDREQLICDPWAVLSNGLETALPTDDGLKWTMIEPMQTRPRGLAAITNRRIKWFTVHYRHITDGPETYVRAPVAVAEDGEVCRVKPMGWNGTIDPLEEQRTVTLSLSIYEDATRSNSIQATVTDGVSLTFPVGSDAYKEFFRDRDGWRETPTGRRNPIIHWCARHLRRGSPISTEVKAHKRGRSEVTVGPMTLTLNVDAPA